jgi:uncharacterized protein (DUF169 family)
MTHKEMSRKLIEAIGMSEPLVAVYYSDQKPEGAFEWNCQGAHFCSIGRLAAVRKGTPMVVDGENPGCMGASFYMGWNEETRPGFEYFLSQDAEGKGERFKKTPELALETMKARTFIPANGRYCVFIRLEDLPEEIAPEVVAMFADADGIAGLAWLANYGRGGKDAVVAPFSAGCGSIVGEVRAQALEPDPKAVLGMFDPAARPRMEKSYLTFAVPYPMFTEMVENIPGSFLEIEPWLNIRNR